MGRATSYLGRYLHSGLFDPILHRPDPKGGPDARIKELEDDVEKLSMVLRALLDHLVVRKSVSLDEVRNLIHTIDSSDGVADGTSKRVPTGGPLKRGTTKHRTK